MRPFLRLTEKAGQTLLINPEHIISLLGGNQQTTVYLVNSQSFTVIESVTQIDTQLQNIQQQVMTRAA